MRVSVIIPSQKSFAQTAVTLRHLLAQKIPQGGVEVIWVSPYPRPQGLGTQFLQFKWITTSQPLSAASARNLGISHSHGELLVFLDDDMLVGADFVLLHLNAHEANTAMGIVRGLRFQVRAQYINSILDAGHITDLKELQRVSYLPVFELEAQKMLTHQRRAGFRTNWIYCITANLSIYRSALPAGPLFDENFAGAACEDTEMCYRLYSMGFRMRMAPLAVGFHVHPFPEVSRKMAESLLQNIDYFSNKYKQDNEVKHITRKMRHSVLQGKVGGYLYGNT